MRIPAGGMPVLQMPVRPVAPATRTLPAASSGMPVRLGVPVRLGPPVRPRTVATRGIDAIVTNDRETACASSDQRPVSQRGCRAAPSHADTDDVANRFARCVAVGGDDAHAIGFGVICATCGG